MTALAKPETFQDIVRDKVRTVIMEAVPAEQIDQLIKKEYDAFFAKTHSYNPSEFEKLVKIMIDEYIRIKAQESIKAVIANEWDATSSGQKLLDEAVTKLAPLALQSVAAALVGNAVYNLQQSLNNQGRF